MNFLAQCLGVLLAWFVVLSVFYVIRFFVKGFTGVDIENQNEIDEAKEKIKDKIASSKTAETLANCIIKDLHNHYDLEHNNYLNNINNENEEQ